MNALLIHSGQSLIMKRLFSGLKYLDVNLDLINTEKEVVQKIYKHSYLAILIDMSMSKEIFINILNNLEKSLINTPIIFFHQNEDLSLMEKIKNQFTNVFFQKFPFMYHDVKNLFYKIKNLKNTFHDENMNFPELLLDCEKRRVIRSDKIISLRNKEFNLLKYLMTNSGKTLSRTDILDHNANLFTNTIDVHINSLRRKVDNGFEHELIRTVHGVGYMFWDGVSS